MTIRSGLAVLVFALLTIGLLGAVGAEEEPAHPDLVLTDVSQATGVAGVAGDRFSFADYDADGDPDLLVGGRFLLRNDTKRGAGAAAPIHFTDVSAVSGMKQGPGGGACWVDFDGDGDLDVVTQNGGLKLQVEAGRFENRAAAWGLPAGLKASTVGVGDVDGDRRPDVLFGGGEDWNGGNAKFYARRLYRNVEGTRFTEVTAEHELATPRYGRAAVWADFDTDGDQDVYLGNYRLQPNELLVNEGGVLKERGEQHGVQGRHEPAKFVHKETGKRFGYQWGHTIAGSWADLDGDGDLDLWVSNLVHKFVGETVMQGKKIFDIRGYLCDDSAIYRNPGPPHYRFEDVRAASDVPYKPIGDRGVYRGDELWSHAACGDLDGDGLPEVFVAQVYQLPYSHALLYRNRGSFRFEEVSGALGLRRFNSYGGALADLDGDGDLDLVCGGSPSPKGKRGICVLRNDTPPGPWVAFDLRGRSPAHSTLGAQLTVVTDRGTFVRQVESCMGSHAQQNERLLRFGLRGHLLRRVFVRWPGSVLQDLAMPKTGQVHVVVEPTVEVPTIEAAVPADVVAGESVRIGLRSKGKGRTRWRWSADIDGDGRFEPLGAKAALTCRLEAPVAEVRVRLTDKKQGLHRERVLRIPVAARNAKDGK